MNEMDIAIENMSRVHANPDITLMSKEVTSLDEMNQEYAVLAMVGLSNFLMPAAEPVDLLNPKDVRWLNQLNDTYTEYKLARYDTVTGALNRLGLYTWMENHYKPEKNTYGVFAVDLTDFKGINDTFDHNIGDTALKEACDFIRRHIRASGDEQATSKTKTRNSAVDVLSVARVGGDEINFIMDLDGVNEEKAREIIQRVEDVLSNTFMTHSDEGKVASFGFRTGSALSTPQNPVDAMEALKIADQVMVAKHSSRN